MKRLPLLLAAILTVSCFSNIIAGTSSRVDSLPTPEEVTLPEWRLPKWRFAVDAAYKYRTSGIGTYNGDKPASPWTEFIDRSKHGYSYGASITRFSDTSLGFGLKFEGEHYSCTGSGLKYKLNTFYIGPEFIGRIPIRNCRHAVILSMSYGYVAFRETLTGNYEILTLKNGGFKGSFEAGFDFRVREKIFLGLKFIYDGGVDWCVKINGEEYRHGFDAFGIGGGIRF